VKQENDKGEFKCRQTDYNDDKEEMKRKRNKKNVIRRE
jgi:hypothetical protein